MELSSSADVPGGSHRKDALVAVGEQHPFEKAAALIVEKVFKPSVFHEFGYHHDDAAIGVLLGKIEDELNDGNDDEAVWRRQHLELWRLFAFRAEGGLDVALPVSVQQFGVLGRVDMQGEDVRGKPEGKLNSLASDVAPAVDGNNGDGRLAGIRQGDGNLSGG